jgi:peroxiredoxin Q/BCP
MGIARSWVAGLAMTAGILAYGVDLQPGMMAPKFEAQDQNGRPVKLQDYIGKTPVVLYFYPKDFTPGCTSEACNLRDHYQEIKDAGAALLGVSADDVKSHADFAQKYNLPFPILADPEGKVIAAYGVKNSLFPSRAARITFIIDKQGKIIDRVDKVDPAKADQEVLASLKKM